LISLIISDVLGDPLDVIASGPTAVDSRTPEEALAILKKFGGAPQTALDVLRSARPAGARPTCRVTNLVIGNNATAVDAAGQEAVRRGYSTAMTAATTLEGPAEEVGAHLAHMLKQMADGTGPDCLITGGEPTVRLAPPDVRGKGGRNQQLVLASLIELLNSKFEIRNPKFCLLSAGTDGEDGPTDSAGAIIDNELLVQLAESGLDPSDYLRRNDAYSFFEQLGGLIKTGPTHTNVCDVRVVLVNRTGKGQER
jgi:glycerate 2-kinase